MGTKDAKNVQKIVASLVKSVSTRNRDIVSRRFGLKNGKRDTLESIGHGYGITRERVRQIEEFTLGQLRKSTSDNTDLERYASLASSIISRGGGIVREGDLFSEFSGNAKPSAENAAFAFLLALSPNFMRVGDSDRYCAFWASDAQHVGDLKNTIYALSAAFKSHGEPIADDAFNEFVKKYNLNDVNGEPLNQRTFSALLGVCKDFGKNIYGEVGLANLPDIRPRGIRDKAYLVMRKETAPQHFRTVSKLINTANFLDGKKTNVQTVHNELIKDKRFVLVGRGLYALTEWGYKSGTVKDVLTDILRSSSKPLTRTELVAKVLGTRMVKENTIVLNLQNSSHFSRKEDGTYALRKA